MISFVGAGPGAADLITLRGAQRLATAETIIWASSLVPKELLAHARPDAAIYDSASMTLEDVLGIYESHDPDRILVRLHSGDPSVYGALYEQIAWCVENSRAFEIVPGVSSVSAAAAALRCELTVPMLSQSVVLTRLAARTSKSMPDRETVESFAATGATLAIFLSGARPVALQRALLAGGSGYPSSTPAAVVVRASWPDEAIHMTVVGELAETMSTHSTKLTALVLVGPVIGTSPLAVPGLAPETIGRSHLYSPSFAHRFRKASPKGSTRGVPTARMLRDRM